MQSINLIKASNGTGNASVATVQTSRSSGASTIIVDTVLGMPTTFFASMGTPHTFVDPITAETITVISEATAVDFKGHIDGSNIEIDTIAAGYTDNGSNAGDIIIIRPTTEWADNIADVLDISLNDDGTLKDESVGTNNLTLEARKGWIANALPAVSSVTNNGNRSYDITFASTVASILSPGMRLKGTKTVAGNGYMGGAFNGSSHYFTRTAANLGSSTLATVTNNFTIEAVVQPTSYAQGQIACRGDAAGANGLYLRMEANGQISCFVQNGGIGNYRVITTYQSVPLIKKTHVTATWASGTTVLIYFDGASVPVQAPSTSGTAPTTAGTGGDFSIGRYGASSSQYFTGYISNVAVFDAVLSAATIKQHATYKLLGSETNCIGAWSLDNTANDQSSAGNNLTATGGVGYTAMSPHGQMGDAVHTDQFCALVMAVSTTTATVQVPEGCTIPTSGGVTSVAYSVQGNPFGWVSDKGRWKVLVTALADITQASPVNGTWYNILNISALAGDMSVGYEVGMYSNRSSAGNADMYVTVSTANNSEVYKDLTTRVYSAVTATSTTVVEIIGYGKREKGLTLSSATTLYLNMKTGSNTVAGIQLINSSTQLMFYAIPSNL